MAFTERYEDVFAHVVPYVRIKDYILKRNEILKLVISSKGFIPTFTLLVSTPSKTLARENIPVDGDRVSIGVRQDLTTFKPIASDFIIKTVENSPQVNNSDSKIKMNEYLITGELFIPNLESGAVNFTYNGYAEDALKDIAIRLGLGFVHTKNTKTAKQESWHCYDDPLEYIRDVTSHMWLAKDSFFDSWIDPRRKLTVINVNDILGRKLSDDGELDFTKYKNIIGTIGADGKYVNNDLAELKDSKYPKMFCNDPAFENSMWYPIEYQYVNNSTSVSNSVGAQKDFEVYVQNNGVGQSENDARHTIEIGVWYMQEKLDKGYVIANGPTNYAKEFKMADNGDWKKQKRKKDAPIIVPIESDDDAGSKVSDQSNLNSSGNFSKEYTIAPEHNKINLAELDKQEVHILTYGANLGILKGEKVPCFLYNKNNEKWLSESRSVQDTGFNFDMVCSGWFYVKGVEWIYEPNFSKNSYLTDWKTKVILTRREWFPPESTSDRHEAEEFGIIENDVAQGKAVESQSPDTSTNITTTTSPDTSVNDVSIIEEEMEDYVETELGGMIEEYNMNRNSFLKLFDSFNIITAITNIFEMNGSIGDFSDAALNIVNSSTDVLDSSTIGNLSDNIMKVQDYEKALNAVLDGDLTSALNIANNSIDTNTILPADKIKSIKDSLGNVMSSTGNITNTMEGITDDVKDLIKNPNLDDAKEVLEKSVENVKDLYSTTKGQVDDIMSLVVEKNEDETTKEDRLIEDEEKEPELSFEELMAYDGNGMKHFMNIFIDTMSSEGMPFSTLGMRRWAVTKDDEKVYGNAFTERQSSETFKTLDSDGNYYWLSDYSSRHYYGEAVDIEATSSLDDLLEKICLNDKVLDVMHKYGISIQVEVSKAGHSKGTHFHCSTDKDNPQSKWWGIVNMKRNSVEMEPYPVILGRDYFEKETKNDVVIV